VHRFLNFYFESEMINSNVLKIILNISTEYIETEWKLMAVQILVRHHEKI
jgi:hypothetical protein